MMDALVANQAVAALTDQFNTIRIAPTCRAVSVALSNLCNALTEIPANVADLAIVSGLERAILAAENSAAALLPKNSEGTRLGFASARYLASLLKATEDEVDHANLTGKGLDALDSAALVASCFDIQHRSDAMDARAEQRVRNLMIQGAAEQPQPGHYLH